MYKRQVLAAALLPQALLFPGEAIASLLFLALLGGVGAAAVSYTHLRAHATVLDLVCRLLLEKKTGSVSFSRVLTHQYALHILYRFFL